MTRHGALQAALEELTAALEQPSPDDGATWLDVQQTGEPQDASGRSLGVEPQDREAETRRAVLEELRGLRPPTPDGP